MIHKSEIPTPSTRSISLIIWVLNDFVWKEVYAGWWTGKLSDLSGMLVLPVLCYVLLGGRRWWSIALSVIVFAWWKSPLSQPVLDLVNAFTPLHLVRVVDWTDLLAYSVLPVSYLLMGRKSHATPFSNPIWRWAPMCVGLFMIVATSDDDGLPNDWQLSGCCANEGPNGFFFGQDSIFNCITASAFTPNNDGVNDVFLVLCDSSIVRVDSLAIYRLRDWRIAHFVERIDQPQAITWDGRVDGTAVNERFTYQMKLHHESDTSLWVYGYVCSITCEAELEFQPAYLEICVWPVQMIPYPVSYDRSLPSLESFDCF